MKTRNFWPLGIIAAFVLFIGGTIALIVVAGANRNELVVADYYEQEIRFQQQMDRMERTRRLESNATVAYDADSRRIIVSLPFQNSQQPIGHIQLYRPSEAGLDQRLDLQLDASGTQAIETGALKSGLWKVKVTWAADGEEYFLDTKVIISAKQT